MVPASRAEYARYLEGAFEYAPRDGRAAEPEPDRTITCRLSASGGETTG
jgi:hypothetical protein